MGKNKDDDYLNQVFVTQTKGYLDVSLKHELWQKISDEFKGKFKISRTSGNVLEILKISIPHKNWEINISESDTRPMKFEISFTSLFDYELVIGDKDLFDKILKRLGRREVEIGNEVFDNKYLIKSQNSEITKRIFKQEIIDDFIKFNICSISYTTNSKKRTSNLISVISRTVDDKLTFKNLVGFHIRIVDILKELKLVE